MRRNAYPVIASASVAIGALMLGTPAQADIQAGTLGCTVGGGPGFIIGASRPLNCTYSGPVGPEHYVGNVAKLWVDIGYLQGGEMVWEVVASAAYPGPGSLAGSYGGVTAGAAVGGGVGANALLGGSTGRLLCSRSALQDKSGSMFPLASQWSTYNTRRRRPLALPRPRPCV